MTSSPDPHETCWTIVRAAAQGDADARAEFARDYEPVIRDYLGYRWRQSRLIEELDDAVQEVFVECVKPTGVLERASPTRGEFRALLYGVIRNVARRCEERDSRRATERPQGSVYLDDLPGRSEALSRMFDRRWARAVLREAAVAHAQAARRGDAGMRRRYRVLQLRHRRGLAIRDVAAALGLLDVEAVHNDYRRARREFRGFLRERVARHTGAATAEAIDAQCRRVTELLGG